MHTLTQDPLATAERMVSRAQMPAPSAASGMVSHGEMAAKIDRLCTELSTLPQCGDFQTGHYFVPQMYCRTMHLKAGTVLVGKRHTVPHFFLFTAGEAQVVRDGVAVTMRAGDVVACEPGAQRVFIAVTDAAIACVYRTDNTDLDKIEREVTEYDERARYDARNRVIAGHLEDK